MGGRLGSCLHIPNPAQGFLLEPLHIGLSHGIPSLLIMCIVAYNAYLGENSVFFFPLREKISLQKRQNPHKLQYADGFIQPFLPGGTQKRTQGAEKPGAVGFLLQGTDKGGHF